MKNIRQLNCPKFIALVTVFVLLTVNVFGQSKKAKRAANYKEQISFSSESVVSNPVVIPRDVLKQLAEYDDRQLEKCQQDEFTRKKNVASHFAAAKINLNGDAQPDLIVQAQTSCFMGAHNTTFWIFTGSGRKSAPVYQLTFDIAVDFLQVLKTSANDYRNIETASHTAVELYTVKWKFDGRKYGQSECKVRDLTTGKVKKVECNP